MKNIFLYMLLISYNEKKIDYAENITKSLILNGTI